MTRGRAPARRFRREVDLEQRPLPRPQSFVAVVELELRHHQHERRQDEHHRPQAEPEVGQVVAQDLVLRPQDRAQVVVEEADLEDAGVDLPLHEWRAPPGSRSS